MGIVMSEIEKISKISNSGRGGARENAGRKKGSPNKITAEIKYIAQEHGEKAIGILVDLMYNANSDTTKVMAAKEILDRAYGKSTQYQEISGELEFKLANRLQLAISSLEGEEVVKSES
jgi:hypothetical protein